MRRRALLLPLLATAALSAGAGVGCGEQTTPPSPAPVSPAAAAGSNGPPVKSGPSAANGADAGVAIVDGGAAPYEGPYAGATVFAAPILSEMEWPPAEGKRSSSSSTSVRIGYLRHGAKAPIVPTPHKKSNCAEGWYELVAGGFVCGKYITLDLNHPRFKTAHPPDLEGMLPYTYGVNGQQGTPLYRHVPSRAERLDNEPWLAKPKKPKPAPSSDSSSDNPYEDAGTPPASDPDAGAAPAADDSSKPWYLRDYDGGAVNITLDELKGEGIVARRMVKGFYLSLDRRFSPTGGTGSWWKTNDGLVAPADSVYVAKSRSEFKGLWFEQAATAPPPPSDPEASAPTPRTWRLPVGFVTSSSGHKYSMGANRKSVSRGASLRRQTIVQLTGEVATIGGTEYWETDEGWWMRGTDGTKTDPGPAPEKLGITEKWIDVNLKRQTLVAFEGDKPVFATIVSSGRAGHETPPGSFRIREKHVASTMDGDAETASDGPYSIQDVPYIEYFNAGYALHGAFWHDSFGNVKSHGCVNLAPWDAKALFGWTEPQLPEGWHGVMATKDKPGTRVVLHY